jgi:hypothetical protein
MDINIVSIIVIIVIAGLCWWANQKLNTVPVLKNVVDVIIVVVAVLCLLSATGIWNGGPRISVH